MFNRGGNSGIMISTIAFIICLIIVIFTNYGLNKDLQKSATEAGLNFDNSLTQYSDGLIGKGMTAMDWIVVIAHIFIPVYIFILIMHFTNNSFFSSVILAVMVILVLHAINFGVIDKEKVTFEAFKTSLPFSGTVHFIQVYPEIKGNVIPHIEEEINNITNTIVQNETVDNSTIQLTLS